VNRHLHTFPTRRSSDLSHFTHYSKYGNKFPKAIEAVLSGSVKKHTFSPSGRVVLTVVGRDGEEFIDPERPFCSCDNFFFKVLGRSEEHTSELQSPDHIV